MKDDLEQTKEQANQIMMSKNLSLIISAKVDRSQSLSFEEGPRIRYTVVRVVQHDFKTENTELLKRLEMYKQQF